MNKRLLREIQETLYVHRPLPLHREESLEARFIEKHVLRTCPVFPSAHALSPAAARGTTLVLEDGRLTFSAPLTSDHWPEGASPDGDYSNFGTAAVSFDLPRMGTAGAASECIRGQ